ncbi:hypothetical protein FF38_01804 [Lucilia cuprina]|uniref:Uncharacterized protein n=1 Tax=Lucilia cuprina TaxID=7375 RepID=A0A0L0C4H0_LUCCU|nr:hypothetical protein FF38_01804 [Lucilia cuprina]
MGNRPTFDLVILGVTLISSVLLAETVVLTTTGCEDDEFNEVVPVIDFDSVAVGNESDLITVGPLLVVEEDPFIVLPVKLSFVCFVLTVLFSISAPAALAAVVEAFVNAPVTDELATDIEFKPFADPLKVEYDNDVGCSVEDGVGVVFVDVVVVVISLKVEPAIDTIGVSGIMAAANEETATATTAAAALGGVVTGKWLLALTTAAKALTVNCVEVEYDSGANDEKDDNGNDGDDDIDEYDVAVVVVLLLVLPRTATAATTKVSAAAAVTQSVSREETPLENISSNCQCILRNITEHCQKKYNPDPVIYIYITQPSNWSTTYACPEISWAG